MTYLVLLIPFIIEVIADPLLIKAGKKDLPLWLRIVLVFICSSYWYFEPWYQPEFEGSFQRMALCASLFMFFDPALNKLRGKPWDYTGKTKDYDVWTGRINPWALLAARVIGFVVLLIYGL